VVALSLQIGISTALSAIVFILGGLWIDRQIGTIPLFSFIGGILGMIMSLFLVWRIVKPLQGDKTN
jgi:hypothetical protein